MLKYDIRKGVTKIKTKTFIAISALGLAGAGFASSIIFFGAAHAAISQSYSTFGQATVVSGGNPGQAVQLSSTCPTGYPTCFNDNSFTSSGLDYTDQSGYLFSSLTNLGTDYKITAGDCGGGSPRFQVNIGGHNVFVYIGPSPNYTGCTTGSWLSTGNLTTSPDARWDTSAYPGGNFYSTYAEAEALLGSQTVTGVQLVVDGGWAVTGNNQTVLADNTQINTTTYDYEPATVTVTIDKYVDGAQATATGTNNTSFPMVSSWSATNIGTSSGSYSLSPSGFNNPNPYFATTSNMTVGASYTTNEVLGTNVNASCSVNGGGYTLAGYTTGDSLAAAAAGTPTTTIPAFTNLQKNEYVIVWNKSCAALTSADQCKNNGWMAYGSTFKNQGDCVSYVATKGKNPPNGPAKH